MQKISGVLNTNLSKIARRFVSRVSQTTDLEWAFRNFYYRTMCAELFEHLLLFDEVAIIMNIDNSPLAILINEFGLNDTAKLIEISSIKLILRKVILASKYGNQENGITEFNGIPPVISGMIVEDNLFGDPVQCIKDAFRFVKYNYPKRDKETFLKRILPFVFADEGNTGQRAVKLLTDAYHSNSLSAVGLPYLVHENNLFYKQRGQILGLASDITDLMLIAKHNYGMYNQAPIYNIAKRGIGELLSAVHISNSMNEITEKAERMPNFKALYFEGKIGFHSVVNIRQKSDSKTFRNWVNERTKENDAEYIINQYIDSINKPAGFFTTSKGKFVKSMVSLGISLGVSQIIPAAPITARFTTLASLKILDHSSNEFLNEIFGSLTSGWTPKLYVDAIKKNVDNE